MKTAEEIKKEFIKNWGVEFWNKISAGWAAKYELDDSEFIKELDRLLKEHAIEFAKYYCKAELPKSWVPFRGLKDPFLNKHMSRRHTEFINQHQ